MKRFWKIFSVVVGAVVLLLCCYVMAKGIGLVPELDFGAGAYYYADIPDFERYTGDGAFFTSIPLWVYIVLFLVWGCLMWRLWLWIEKH